MKLKNGEKLTKKVAHRVCLELWTDLAKTGGEKDDWEGWKKYGRMENGCPFCKYVGGEYNACHNKCPLQVQLKESCFGLAYGDWDTANDEDNDEDRKKYAKLFLEQLRKL